MALANASVYGKLRSSPEFLGSLPGDAGTDWLDWLDRANGMASMDDAWLGAFHMGEAHGFTFRRTASTRGILGAITPSQDSFGRPFPLMVVASTGEDVVSRALSYVPVAGHVFFRTASDVLRDARRAASPDHLSSVSKLEPPDGSAISVAGEEFNHWATRPGVLVKAWRGVFPRRGARGSLPVLTALAKLRDEPSHPTPSYARFPLGAGGAAAASFWLRLLACFVPESRIAMACWDMRPHGDLFVAIGAETPLESWLRLWLPDYVGADLLDADKLSDLDIESAKGLGEAAKRAAVSTEASVADLLSCLTG
ncbi:type VI secretion system-associated protein TagF [Pendulispora rubella]|uniref:Type VI secretion system-associated protein TagF n=1 Tax=Pendulispora rubella TaxID=2741070 RepID=A0ABZ2KU79_9BACT